MDVRIPIRDRSKGLVPRNAGIPNRGRKKKKASDGRGCEDPRTCIKAFGNVQNCRVCKQERVKANERWRLEERGRFKSRRRKGKRRRMEESNE